MTCLPAMCVICRKEERKRHEEALARAQSEAADREKAVMEDVKREKEAMRKAHDKQVRRKRSS